MEDRDTEQRQAENQELDLGHFKYFNSIGYEIYLSSI